MLELMSMVQFFNFIPFIYIYIVIVYSEKICCPIQYETMLNLGTSLLEFIQGLRLS